MVGWISKYTNEEIYKLVRKLYNGEPVISKLDSKILTQAGDLQRVRPGRLAGGECGLQRYVWDRGDLRAAGIGGIGAADGNAYEAGNLVVRPSSGDQTNDEG